MQYFTELLESFDLIKKRKFKLQLEEGIEPPPGGSFPMQIPAGNLLMSSPYADEGLQKTFTTIDGSLTNVFENLSNIEREVIPTSQSLKDIFLNSPTSLENQLATLSKIELIEHTINPNPVPINKATVIGIANNLAIIAKLLSKKNLSNSDCEQVKSIVGYVGNYAVIFEQGNSTEGLVTTSPLFLKLLAYLERKYNVQFNCLKSYSDSDFISKNEVTKLIPIIANSTVNPAFSKIGTNVLSIFEPQVTNLITSIGKYVTEFIQSIRGVLLTQFKYIQTYSTFFGLEGATNINLLINTFRNSIAKRKPLFILPLRTGGSYELYASPKAPIKGVSLTPYNSQLIAKEIDPSLVNPGLLPPSLFYHQVNYRVINQFEDIIIKDCIFDNFSQFINGSVDKANMLSENKLKSLISAYLKLSGIQGLRQYNNYLDKIKTNIFSLSPKINIKTSSGKYFEENLLKRIISSLVKDVKKNSLYDEIISDRAKGSILSLQDIEDFEDPEKLHEIRSILFSYLKLQKLLTDLNSNNQDAVNYILAQILYLGLNLNENASLEIKVINTQENFIIPQNFTLKRVMTELEQSEFTFKVKDFSLLLVNNTNNDCFIELKDSYKNNNLTTELIYSSEFITSYNV